MSELEIMWKDGNIRSREEVAFFKKDLAPKIDTVID